MASRMKFEVGFAQPEAKVVTRRRPRDVLRILYLADLGGNDRRGRLASAEEIAGRRTLRVDAESIHGLVKTIGPRAIVAHGPEGDGHEEITFRELDDFHPDRLFAALPRFAELREIRERLVDPTTFDEAAANLRDRIGEPAEAPVVAPTSETAESDSDAIERLLGRPPSQPQPDASSPAETLVQRLAREAVAPSLVKSPDAQQAALVASVEDAIAGEMRAVLHGPALQELESTWRSLHRLVDSLETDEQLQVHVLDLSKREVSADLLSSASGAAGSALYKSLVENGSGSQGREPWSLLVTDYRFGATDGDLRALAELGWLAREAGGPVIADADPAILGCQSLQNAPDPAGWQLTAEARESWDRFRRSADARWVGLALPRVLLREPYGAQTDPIESFPFEELEDEPDHEKFLWGSAAAACAVLIGQSFSERGWEMELGDVLEIDDLPACLRHDGRGGQVLQACAEAYLSERTGEEMLHRGLMPFMSYRNRNAVKLLRFQSVADPLSPLAGPWS